MATPSGFFRRGSVYRNALEQVDIRIAVSGIRGKSSTVRRLHDVFQERGYDTFAKVTGDEPYTLHNGEKEPIRRTGSEVTLYENRRLITNAVERLAATDLTQDNVAIFENHALTEYTMRVFNETFFRPDVVVMPNVRTDHNDTLGRTRQDIARSFARSIPAGTHVISGEGNDAIHDYLAAELESRDVTVSRVTVPERYQALPGAETVFIIDRVLDAAGESALSDGRVESLLEPLHPSWTTLEDGSRVFNAAKVNDPESTELFRQRLAGQGSDAELICPFVFLRGDRRGRTAGFVEYIDDLYDRDCIDRLHVAGANARTFARRVDPPAAVHDGERASPASVIDAVLAEDQPVMTMANTVHPFMRALVAELNDRTGPGGETIEDTDSLPAGVDGGSDAPVTDDAGVGPDGERTGVIQTGAPDTVLEVYRDRSDDWRWRLVHRNGNVLADGTRGYESREAVEAALDRVTTHAAEARVIELGTHEHTPDGTGDDADGTEDDADGTEDDADGTRDVASIQFEVYADAADEWRWRLRNDEGTILADSGEGYASKGNARRGMHGVIRSLPAAAVEPAD